MTVRRGLRSAVLSVGGALRRPPQNSIRVLNGHTLDEGNVPRFRATLRLLRNRYEFVTVGEAAALLREPHTPRGRYLALSFDDGYRDNFELIAPVLAEFGAPACFFVCTNFIDSMPDYQTWFFQNRVRSVRKPPMTWAMVRELAEAGFAVGAHTTDHLDLAKLPLAEAMRQVLDSKAAVETRLARSCEFFAWPYGRLTAFSTDLVGALRPHFKELFSATRARSSFTFGSAAVNREHFEPGWPAAHVNFFLSRRHV